MKFDDTRVSIIHDLESQIYYGEPPNGRRSMGWPCAYMLLYESEDLLNEFFIPQIEQAGQPKRGAHHRSDGAARQTSANQIGNERHSKDKIAKNNPGRLR